MAFHVYILCCADGSYYTGHTDNLEARLVAHEGGLISGYTKFRRPVQLVYSQAFDTRDEAFREERQIKGWTRAKKEALMGQNWGSLVELSRAHGSTSSP